MSNKTKNSLLKSFLLLENFKKAISDLVEYRIWHIKTGAKIKISAMSDHHLLFSHRFLVNSIESLNITDDFNFNDEVFKLSVLAMEGINIFVEEIKFRGLSVLPSKIEVYMNSNESLKSKNELSFNRKFLEKKSMCI